MKSFVAGIVTCFMSLLFPMHACQAEWLHDYKGTLGTNKIGLTITTDDDLNYVMGNSKIERAHYFYVQDLTDIPLRLESQIGREITFKEYDAKGDVKGIFKLEYALKDPQKHFKSLGDLDSEVLVGSWRSADEQTIFPVYLLLEDTVSGGKDGGRCDLMDKQYQQVEEKIRRFYIAATRGDVQTLKTQFGFNLPSHKTKAWEQSVANAVPHDLFCNAQGFMLGNGIVWFDSDGVIIK